MPASSGKWPTSAFARVPTSPPLSGAEGWPAGLSTTRTFDVFQQTASGASGEGVATVSVAPVSSTPSSSETERASPVFTCVPFMLRARRPLIFTEPLSIAFFTRAREAPGTSSVSALSRRAPFNDSGTANS